MAQEKLKIEEDDDKETLIKKLTSLGTDLLIKTLLSPLSPARQDEKKATFCKKIAKEDGKISWDEDAFKIEAKIRAFIGWPGAYTSWNGKNLKIIKGKTIKLEEKNKIPGAVAKKEEKIIVYCGKNALQILKLQLEGKKEMDVKDFINGYPNFINSCLL